MSILLTPVLSRTRPSGRTFKEFVPFPVRIQARRSLSGDVRARFIKKNTSLSRVLPLSPVPRTNQQLSFLILPKAAIMWTQKAESSNTKILQPRKEKRASEVIGKCKTDAIISVLTVLFHTPEAAPAQETRILF